VEQNGTKRNPNKTFRAALGHPVTLKSQCRTSRPRDGLARGYERLVETLAGWHWVAFIALMLARLNFQSA
jgi:hypothetical protein